MGKKPIKETKDERNEAKQLEALVADVAEIVEAAQRHSVRAVNATMTATYWSIGCRIVEEEQRGKHRADYGVRLLAGLAVQLTQKFGRGFSVTGLERMRAFYLAYPNISATLSPESNESSQLNDSGYLHLLSRASQAFPLPWSHYVRLMRINSEAARRFYEIEALKGGWSERQLSRQISTQFFERTIRAKDRESFLQNGRRPQPDDHVTLAETIKEPYLLEFLDLKDEYSESDAEEALVDRIQEFLLTAADAGQINLYCNYAREHWMREGENPPVGLVLCTEKGAALAHYAFEGLGSKVLAAEYRTILPSETELAMEVARAHVEIARRQLPEPAEPRTKKPRGGGGGGSRAGEAVAPWLAAAMLH